MLMLGIARSLIVVNKNGVGRMPVAVTRRSSSEARVQELRSSELVAMEYADLNLSSAAVDSHEEVGGHGHVRIRQHVNPLSSSFTVPAPLPDWPQVFANPTLPLMIDIGSGSGRFLIWHAKTSPHTTNFLGLEIRQKLVKRAQLWVKQLTLNNICFLFANATVSFEHLVSTYPGPLVFVSILVILQSDVHEVADDMRFQFDSHLDKLEHIDTLDPSFTCDDQGWLLQNPMGVRTEREIHAEFEGGRIYRRMYQKRDNLLLQH